MIDCYSLYMFLIRWFENSPKTSLGEMSNSGDEVLFNDFVDFEECYVVLLENRRRAITEMGVFILRRQIFHSIGFFPV